MPYGEEIASGVGGRTTGQGYGQADNARQKFTGYERDDESGLDFAQNRYYSNKHGRFTSVDPLAASASIKAPQSLNRYTYGNNSPYKFTDPIGLKATEHCWDNLCSTYAADEQADDGFNRTIGTESRRAEADYDRRLNNTIDAANDDGIEGQSGSALGQAVASQQQARDNGVIDDPNKNPTYNCAAWAFGFTDRWIQPGSEDNGDTHSIRTIFNHKAANERRDTTDTVEVVRPEDLPSYYGGKKTTADATLGADRYRVIVITDKKNEKDWHLMRQDPSTGLWSSKNGDGKRWKDIKDPVAFYNTTAYPDQRPNIPKGENRIKNLVITYYSMPIKLIQPKK